MKRRVVAIIFGLAVLSAAGAATAEAVKPLQGSVFDRGECTTTSGHGSNATQESDTGNCKSADNPNKGDEEEGINTGHGFVPKPGRG